METSMTCAAYKNVMIWFITSSVYVPDYSRYNSEHGFMSLFVFSRVLRSQTQGIPHMQKKHMTYCLHATRHCCWRFHMEVILPCDGHSFGLMLQKVTLCSSWLEWFFTSHWGKSFVLKNHGPLHEHVIFPEVWRSALHTLCLIKKTFR